MAVDSKNCEAGAIKGTAVLDCQIPLDIEDGFIAAPTSWEFDPSTETFDIAYINQKIKEGVFIPLLGARDFADNSEETQFKTYNTGDKIPVRDGKPEKQFTYSNGYAWHKAVYSLKGLTGYGTIAAYKNNVLGFGKKSDGKLKALNANYFDVPNFKSPNGSDPGETMVMFQLSNNAEYNNMALIDGVENGFTVNEILGYYDLAISIPTVPLDGTSAFSAKVTLEYNPAINIKGLTVDDFKLTGRTIDTATFNENTGLWDFTVGTPFSSGDVETLRTDDGTYRVVEAANGKLYKGVSNSFTIA